MPLYYSCQYIAQNIYRTCVRFNRGLHFIFVFLKFGGIPLMFCGLFSREAYFGEMLNLTRVRYMIYILKILDTLLSVEDKHYM